MKFSESQFSKVLPILVRQANAQEPITYESVAKEIGAHHRNIGNILGVIGDKLNELSQQSGKDIPPIQAMVVTKSEHVPGVGIEGYIAPSNYAQMSRSQKRVVVNNLLQRIYLFPDWNWVLYQFNLTPLHDEAAKEYTRELKKQHSFAGGESEAHKEFKLYISDHPEVIGLNRIGEGRVEYQLPSMDEIDVLFRDGDLLIGVEVKSNISSPDDIFRGIFQCIKYQYLLEAEQKVNGDPVSSRVILALQGLMPKNLLKYVNTLGIEYVENIQIIKSK